MNRIKFMQGYWSLSPTKKDFAEYDAEVLISRMLYAYFLGADGEIQMLHPFQIADAITDQQIIQAYKEALFNLVNTLSDNDWNKVCKDLNYKYENNHA